MTGGELRGLSLCERVQRGLLAITMGLAGVVSPVTVMAASATQVFDPWNSPATTVVNVSERVTTTAAFDPTQAMATYRAARLEAEIAGRVLAVISDDRTPEFDAYLDSLDSILDRLPESIGESDARWLAASLFEARERVLSETSTFQRWRRIQRAIDPTLTGPQRVPRRFVRRTAARPELRVVIDESDIRVDRAVRGFLGSE